MNSTQNTGEQGRTRREGERRSDNRNDMGNQIGRLESRDSTGRYSSGRKMAGSMLPTRIFPLPSPSMLTAMPMMMVPPTALISVMAAGSRKGPTQEKRSVRPPW